MYKNAKSCTWATQTPKKSIFMGVNRQETTEEERDLGVTMTSKLKPSVQWAKAARTAQMVLGQITRAFHFRDKHVFVQLYKTQLEFAIQA